MDPNETLKKILEAAEALDGFEPTRERPNPDAATVEKLVVYVLAMDYWMRNQGFLPSNWARGRS